MGLFFLFFKNFFWMLLPWFFFLSFFLSILLFFSFLPPSNGWERSTRPIVALKNIYIKKKSPPYIDGK